MAKTRQEKEDAAQYVEELREALPAGATVLTIVKHVSSSGMSRVIAFYYIDEGYPRWINMDKVNGLPMHRTIHGYVVKGCGMDMAWNEVYCLSRVLHGDGYALKQSAL